MQRLSTSIIIKCAIILCSNWTQTSIAALAVDVSQKDISFLKKYLMSKPASSLTKKNSVENIIKEQSRHEDFNSTTHIRASQTFGNFPVFGADIVIHVPNGEKLALKELIDKENVRMNGVIFENLQLDLKNPLPYIFKSRQAKLALTRAISYFQHNARAINSIKNQESSLLIYVDPQHKAHFAFHVSFYVKTKDTQPAYPNYIIDAVYFNIYKQWNNIKTFEPVKAGGYGGNMKTGKLQYDGLNGNRHLPTLTMMRDPQTKQCYLQTETVQVKTYIPDRVASFKCEFPNDQHNQLYWNTNHEEVNGGYSPNNDALFVASMTEAMYRTWYNLPLLSQDGLPATVTVVTHSPNFSAGDLPNPDAAYFDVYRQAAYFGDGLKQFYPMASIDVGAHELSHGFTHAHSKLIYDDQSGGLDESFSDMAAKAVEYFVYKRNRWDLGSNITKAKGKAFRYMDKPSKDCNADVGAKQFPDNCSIDDMSFYHPNLEMHQLSGIYNRAFYLIATAKGWDSKKAFDIMLKANVDYWTSNTTFAQAACGVIYATKDYQYDLTAVRNAFAIVKLDVKNC